jgi:hypothetical protein
VLISILPLIPAYELLIGLSYPFALFKLLTSGGLLLLYTRPFKSYNWDPPFRAHKYAVVFFFLSNVFLTVVPMMPLSAGFELYEHLPYYVSCPSNLVAA